MTTTKFRVLVWGGWYGSKNVGDQALLLSISDLVGKVVKNIEFIVITANPDHVRFYTKRDSVHSFTAIKPRTQFMDLVLAFRKSNILVFGGGVPFYDDVSHSAAIAFLVLLSKVFRVPYMLWSVSSLPIRSRFTRFVLRFLLGGASLITCRDSHTRKLFLECEATEEKVQLIPDPAFSLRSGKMENAVQILQRAGWTPEHARPLVALTPRLLRGADGEAHTHYIPQSANDNQKEVEVFSAVLDWLCENGYQPIFAPMNTVPPDSDLESARQIISYSRHGENSLVIAEEIFPRDAANIYSHCQAAFVTRVHGSITAFLGYCPVMMYAFGLKHIGIMEQMKMSKYVFDPSIHSAQDAVDLIAEILDQRVNLIEQMKVTYVELLQRARFPLDVMFRNFKGS